MAEEKSLEEKVISKDELKILKFSKGLAQTSFELKEEYSIDGELVGVFITGVDRPAIGPEIPGLAKYLNDKYGKYAFIKDENGFLHTGLRRVFIDTRYGYITTKDENGYPVTKEFHGLLQVPIGRDFSPERLLSAIKDRFEQEKIDANKYKEENSGRETNKLDPVEGNKTNPNNTLEISTDRESYELGYQEGLLKAKGNEGHQYSQTKVPEKPINTIHIGDIGLIFSAGIVTSLLGVYNYNVIRRRMKE